MSLSRWKCPHCQWTGAETRLKAYPGLLGGEPTPVLRCPVCDSSNLTTTYTPTLPPPKRS